ncbi:MAG: S9 family peptidase [Bacteroidetes bacterium]|nr:S9 family peptidase [Bacteroidota bacterium]MCL1968733.1 S9 family peptidase [Bacteroidota bacterium]
MKKIFLIIVTTVAITAFSQTLTLENIFKEGVLRGEGVAGFQPMPASDFYTVTTKNTIDKHNFATGEYVTTLLSNDILTSLSDDSLTISKINSYSFSKNENKMLLATEVEYIYRRTSKGFYYLFDIKENKIIPVSDKAKGKISFATFSDNGDKIAFVRNLNLFYLELKTGKEVQVTFDGKENHILNGLPDWVYEEELDIAKTFFWSPNGKYLAYMRFDESNVKEFSMTMWGELYPEAYKYKYPKAGEENSLVEIYVYNTENNKSVKVDIKTNEEVYYPRLYWLSNSTDLMVLQLNRLQNKLEFVKYNVLNHNYSIVFTDTNPYWLNVTHNYYFLTNNNSMILTSERNGFNHIYLVDFNGNIKQLTSGNWEIASIEYVNQKTKQIYYLSNENDRLGRNLFVIDFLGKKKTRISKGEGWNAVSFSATGNYYRNTFSTQTQPQYYTINDNKGNELRILQNNAKLKEKMQEYNCVNKEFFQFTTIEGVTIDGWMMKPADFNPAKKYPVLVYTYGGPGSVEVNRNFNVEVWYQYLAQHGYIVACADGRGSGCRGDAFKKVIYKQMGKYESDDQIAFAKYLKTLPYVNPDRIGIWGWSFGGYLSALSLFKGEDAFAMAIAVAPVTNWRYYDNIYTERFQRTPQENPEGYDENSPVFWADKLQGKFLLIHGTADDNVHFQNSIDLVTALNSAGKQYEMFFYPNKNHNISGGNTRLHLYTLMSEFIFKNL